VGFESGSPLFSPVLYSAGPANFAGALWFTSPAYFDWVSGTPIYLLLSFLYLSNLTPLWGIKITYPMLWSLAVEEHFYLVWPAVIRRLSSVGLAWIAFAIILIEPLARAVTFKLGREEGLSSYTWLVADGLVMGAALALYVRLPKTSRKGLTGLSLGLISSAALMLLAGAPFGILTRMRVVGASLQLTAANLLFAGLLGVALLLGTSRYSLMLRPWGLGFFGNISYGLYLIHWMSFYWYDSVVKVHFPGLFPSHGRFGVMTLRFVIAGGVAILVAAISRRYFEEPFLRLKERFAA
jgi:peptidoglycan/LPS O-acetylase OafA/YrhL